jgi:hypothetical protein
MGCRFEPYLWSHSQALSMRRLRKKRFPAAQISHLALTWLHGWSRAADAALVKLRLKTCTAYPRLINCD